MSVVPCRLIWFWHYQEYRKANLIKQQNRSNFAGWWYHFFSCLTSSCHYRGLKEKMCKIDKSRLKFKLHVWFKSILFFEKRVQYSDKIESWCTHFLWASSEQLHIQTRTSLPFITCLESHVGHICSSKYGLEHRFHKQRPWLSTTQHHPRLQN